MLERGHTPSGRPHPLSCIMGWIAPTPFKRQGKHANYFAVENSAESRGTGSWRHGLGKRQEIWFWKGGKRRNQRVHTTHHVKGCLFPFLYNQFLFTRRGRIFFFAFKERGCRKWEKEESQEKGGCFICKKREKKQALGLAFRKSCRESKGKWGRECLGAF